MDPTLAAGPVGASPQSKGAKQLDALGSNVGVGLQLTLDATYHACPLGPPERPPSLIRRGIGGHPGYMSQTIGTCPLCGESALLEYTGITAEEMTQPAMRLTDVACKNEGCKNYISTDRVVAALGRDSR